MTHETENASYTENRGQRHDGDGDGVAGFFRRLFGSDETTGYYENAVRSGQAVVTVDSDESRVNDAVDIMNRNGAVDVEREPASSVDRGDRRQDEKAIPVIEEELEVGTRVVTRGGVRVYSRVVNTPVEEQVTLHEERVRVDRRPVDRIVSEADAANLRDQTIEVFETVEEPVVSKRARVVEEVSLGKDITERKETIRDNVRRTEVKVENVGPEGPSTRGVNDREFRDREFRDDSAARYAASGATYDSYAPAYQYGYNAASDPRFKGKSWGDAESNLETDYLRNNPNSTWDRMRGAVRYGWEKVTGRRSAA